VATLKERNIDIGLAVKAGYAGLYGDISTEVGISSQQKN
jgi:hypothetical protein